MVREERNTIPTTATGWRERSTVVAWRQTACKRTSIAHCLAPTDALISMRDTRTRAALSLLSEAEREFTERYATQRARYA